MRHQEGGEKNVGGTTTKTDFPIAKASREGSGRNACEKTFCQKACRKIGRHKGGLGKVGEKISGGKAWSIHPSLSLKGN